MQRTQNLVAFTAYWWWRPSKERVHCVRACRSAS